MIMALISTVSLIIVSAVENPHVRYAFLVFGRSLNHDIALQIPLNTRMWLALLMQLHL